MNTSDLSLRDLGYFVAICDHEHLSWAAEHLQVAQPTLSHALARLERQLEQTLLDRPRNRRAALRPTAAGGRLLARARAMLELAAHLEQDLAGADLIAGPLVVGSIQSLNLTLLPPVLARFATAEPAVELTLRTLQGTEIARALRRDAVELAVVAGAPAEHLVGLVTQELYVEQFAAIVRRDDPLAAVRKLPLKRLAERDLVLVPPDSFTGRAVLAACAEAGFRPRVRLALASGEALRETVRAGLGVTILPRGYLGPHDPDLVAVALHRPSPHRSVLLAESADRRRSPAAARFAAILGDQADQMQAVP
jgi:LysR family transcriptional activator of glutamate synthase operon